MGANRRVGPADFEGQLALVKGYIRTTNRFYEWRSGLYDANDLSQEAALVLWKVITKYPSARGEELIKLFKRSLKNRYTSLFRRDKIVKLESKAIPFDPLAAELDQARRGVMGRLLPWDFFRCRLATLAARLGRERYESLCLVSSRIKNGPLRRKEEALKEIL